MADHEKIHEWYKANGRHNLPWRNTDDPYKIWVSEIMLQQTRVETVLERFYFPFLEAFPTLQALADAPQEAVMKRWEGLGYYNRAANLHKAAKLAAPTLPESEEELEKLPGIGKSTAHAVAAFAWHLPLPILDANVKRVLCRFFALRETKEKVLWEKAWALLDRERPYDYNQAMMDLGAMVCTPKNPLCEACPLAAGCRGKERPETYPEKRKKKPVPIRERVILVSRDAEGRLRLFQRTERFLHGLWSFPQLLPGDLLPAGAEKLGEITHVYSHFRLEASVFLAPASPAPEEQWFLPEELENLPLSKADHLALALLFPAKS